MQANAVGQLLAMLPSRVHAFEGSEYPLPVKSAMLGDAPLDLETLRAELRTRQGGDPKDLIEPLLLAAEQIEAAQPDRGDFFLTDAKVRSLVFTGSKWRAGWALVLGGEDQQSLVEALQAREFMVFTDAPDLDKTIYIGSRETSPIYFLQLMVRYGLLWGRIAPGDDHEMGHFLERDMPGFLIIYDDLPPVKYLLALGLIKMGAPAVVPPTFPFPYGRRVVASDVQEIVERGGAFENLRQRYFDDEIISLPVDCNPAYLRQEFEPAQRLGGTARSFLAVRRVVSVGSRASQEGEPARELGILIEIADADLSPDVAFVVEQAALRALNMTKGVRGLVSEGILTLELEQGVPLDTERLADAIYWGIRSQYPRLREMAVRFIFDPGVLEQEAAKVWVESEHRRDLVDSMTEANTEIFGVCTECRPFAQGHTCIITPERMPMCGSRTYLSLKAQALYGSSRLPWRRRTESAIASHGIFEKGRVLDLARGEYEGANHTYRQVTEGQLERVYLHSLRGFPHTSCGCFNALAFWIEEVQGIGIMSRNSEAVAPGGQTWDALANRAGGKQCPGITGVSIAYVRSPRFMEGDGGIGNVVWVDEALYARVADIVPAGQAIATEKTVSDLPGLVAFLEQQRPRRGAAA